MPKLAAFPKLYMQALCKEGSMSIAQWVDLASELPIDGLEWYSGFLEMQDRSNWDSIRRKVEEKHKRIFGVKLDPDFPIGFRAPKLPRGARVIRCTGYEYLNIEDCDL